MGHVYDYQSMADEHKRMVEKYETEAPVIKRGMDFYCCPPAEREPSMKPSRTATGAERNWGGADEAGNNNGVFVLWKRWL